MATRLSELATLVVGSVVGDPTLEIRAAAPLIDAGPGDITFVDKLDKAARLAQSQASAVVVPHDFPTASLAMPAIVSSDVHRAFAAIAIHFRPRRVY